jgi:hypothetical protein
MNYSWINNFSGIWNNNEDQTLIITPYDDENATVDLLIFERPLSRSWCQGKPTINMHGLYNPEKGPSLDVDLGRPGFLLELNFAHKGLMGPNTPDEISVGVSWHVSDKDAANFQKYLGKLGSFKKINAEQSSSSGQQGHSGFEMSGEIE